MTRQELRDELKKYKEASKRYYRSKRELEELETLLESVSVDYTKAKVKSSPEPDTLANSIDKLARLHKQVLQEGNDAIEEMFNVRGLIDKSGNEIQRDILIRRYIDLDRGIKLKGWEIIASETHFSIGRLHQIERKALDSIIKRLHTITH